MAGLRKLAVFSTVFSFLAALSPAALVSSSKECVLDVNGKQICSGAAASGIQLSVRQSSCEENDFTCWCLKAIALTNDIRSRNGNSKALKAGTISMLNNAVKHSKDMMHGLGLEHQDLPTVTSEVGCGVFISGENIAMNSGMNDRDPAEQCMTQWETSSGHFQNIMSDNDMVVIGIYREGGQTWCTQTFGQASKSNSDNSAQCNLVGESGGVESSVPVNPSAQPLSPSREPVTSMPSTTETHNSSQPSSGDASWKPSSAEINLSGSVIPLPKCNVKEMSLPNGGKFILGSDCSVPSSVTTTAQNAAYEMAMGSKTFMGMLEKCGDVAQGTLTQDKGGLAVFDGYFRIPSGENDTGATWRALFAHEVAHACNKVGHSPEQDELVASCLCDWNLEDGHYITQSSPGYIQKLTCQKCKLSC